jgi:hypothetical protein
LVRRLLARVLIDLVHGLGIGGWQYQLSGDAMAEARPKSSMHGVSLVPEFVGITHDMDGDEPSCSIPRGLVPSARGSVDGLHEHGHGRRASSRQAGDRGSFRSQGQTRYEGSCSSTRCRPGRVTCARPEFRCSRHRQASGEYGCERAPRSALFGRLLRRLVANVPSCTAGRNAGLVEDSRGIVT